MSCILRTSVQAFAVSTLAAGLTAQFAAIIPRTFHRDVVDASAARARRIVVTDMTGNLMPDVVTLTITGQLILSSSPEVMAASATAPWTGWTDIASVPAPSPGTSGAVLGVLNGEVQLVQYSHQSGFTRTALSAAGWNGLARIETQRVSASSVLVLAIGTNDTKVVIGSLDSTPTLSHIGTINSPASVTQAGFHEVQSLGSNDVLLRTANTLSAYTVTGVSLQVWSAPSGFTDGPFAPLVRPSYDRLAWILRGAAGYSLRVIGRTGVVQDVLLDLPEIGANFDLISVASGDVDADGVFDLLLHQRTPGESGIRQFVLRNANTTTPFSLTTGAYGFVVPGVSTADTAGSLVTDMNNSGSADGVFVTSSPTRLHVVTGLREEIAPPPPSLAEYPDIVSSAAFSFMGTTPTGVSLNLAIPAAYQTTGWSTEVLTWRQTVLNPTAPPFNAMSLEPAGFLLRQGVANPTVTVTAPFGPTWTATRHYYMQLRFVQLSGNTVVASSPARLIGVIAHAELEPTPTDLTYIRSISTPANGYELPVGGGGGGSPKLVGHVKKPLQVSPPAASVPTDG